MNGTGRDNDSSRPVDSLDSFEHLEGDMNGQSDGEFEPDLPFDVLPPEFQPTKNGFSQDDLEDPGIIGEERLTNESLGGDIIHFDDQNETSGLLNESELLNHREHQYDSGSNCPSEDIFHNDGDHLGLGEGSSTDLLQRYMEVTPRADTSLPDFNYASDRLHDDGSFGYSDDVFDHREHFYNNNSEQYLDGLTPEKSDRIGNYRGSNMSSGISNGEGRTQIDSEDLSDGASTELNNTVVVANGLRAGTRPAVADVENYGDDPPDSKDSDSASMSIGQFVPNSVNRNRLPRPMGKPMKRSTPKGNERELMPSDLKRSQQGSVGSRSARSSARNSPRVSAAGSHRSRNSTRYSERSEDPSDRSNHRHPRSPDTSDIRQRPNRVPRLDLRRTSTASSANLSLLSDPSRLDFSLRLQAESKTRQQADEFNDQLQKNYDELLGKYARAENTIDQLKLGARVNLYGDTPAPGQSFQGTLSPSQRPGVVNFGQPQKATVHHIVSSSSHVSGGQAGGQPTDQPGHSNTGIQTNNNNILGPAGTRPSETARTSDSGFPAGEGIVMALAFQVKSQQEQIDSFGVLLQENQLAPSEQKTVLDRLRADQGKLEADYMRAKEEHNALRRRNSLLSGGTEATFDPDRQLEGEIFQLGMKLEDVAEIVQNNLRNNPPTTLSPSRVNQPQELTNGDGDLQERLRQELKKRFQNSRQAEERHSYSGGEDEQDDPGLEHDEPHLSYHSGNSILPSESSEECHSQDDAPLLFSPPKASRPPQTKEKERNSRNKILTDGQRRSKQSQLPRPTTLIGDNKSPNHNPHGSPHTRQRPVHTREGALGQKTPQNGFMSPEADSGFMGSESSRQSNQNGGSSGYDGWNQLRKPRERQSIRSSKLHIGQRSTPQVNRRLPGDWESPQFSDYDISERDEDVEEASTQSGGVGKRKPGPAEKTPVAKSTSQTNRRSADKPKQRATTVPSDRLQPPGLRSPSEKQQRDHHHSREPRRTLERQQTPERRGTGTKSSEDPNKAWNDYRETSVMYPEPTSYHRQLPNQNRDAPHTRHNNPKEVTRIRLDPARGSKAKGPVDVLRQKPRMAPRHQRGYDSESDVTRSSGKSEAIRGLQGEIELLKRQMASLNSPERIQKRSPVVEGPHRPRSGLRRSSLDSVGSEVGSGRSEILRALQNEIDDLRDQVNGRETSPPMYGSPLSRGSLREPQRDDYRDGSHFGSPPPRGMLRETLRQTYIPQSVPREHSFTRIPTRSFLASGFPYRSQSWNPAPQFESTPFPESPSLTHKSYHPSSFLTSRVRVPPDSGVTPSPVYTSRLEPCPMCSGSGVHTHGEYSYPRDLHRNLTIHPPGTVESVPPRSNAYIGQDGPTQYPSSTSQTQPVYGPNPPNGHMQAGLSKTLNQAPFSKPGQLSTSNPNQVLLNQQSAQRPQPVFNPQPVSNPVLNQRQPALNQPQPEINQPSLVLQQPQQVLSQPQPTLNQPQPLYNQPQQMYNQPQPMLNQPQPVLNQPQPVLNQPQPVSSQPQPVSNNPQPVSNTTAQAPVSQGVNQAMSTQTPVLGQAQTIYTPVANCIPLVTIPVYTGIPVNATPQGTSEKQSNNRTGRKPKKSTDSQKSTRGPQDTGGTTIYITPTKRRGRYYVLDDEQADSTGMEEEYYYRRTPRGSSSAKGSSFMRKSKDYKYAHSSSIDLNEAMKMADQLNRSSHRMLETVRNDVSQSQFL